MWIGVHYLVWDPSTTTESEKVSLESQIEFFTKPDIALTNIYITLGHVSNILKLSLTNVLDRGFLANT